MCVAIKAVVASGDPLKPALESNIGVGRLIPLGGPVAPELKMQFGRAKKLTWLAGGAQPLFPTEAV